MNNSTTTNTKMPSTSRKTVAKNVTATITVAPTQDFVVETPASEVVAPKKRAAAKKAVETVAPVVAAPAPVAVSELRTNSAQVDVAMVEDSAAVVESSWDADLVGLLDTLKTLNSTVHSLTIEAKKIQKKATKAVKDAGKRKKSRKTETTEDGVTIEKRVSHFKIPRTVSPELNHFLGQQPGELICRADVNRAISTYAQEHGLSKGINITVDAKLGGLLGLPVGETCTIFTLQKYMKVHYPKAEMAATA